MPGPSLEFRLLIAGRLNEIDTMYHTTPREVTQEVEDQLERILDVILEQCESEMQTSLGSEFAGEVIESVNEWAGLLSYAVGRVYAPTSPWFQGLGGWGRGTTKSLREAARIFGKFANKAASDVGATGFGVSVGFPFGVSVGLSWPVGSAVN
jgi:hypothetical protein